MERVATYVTYVTYVQKQGCESIIKHQFPVTNWRFIVTQVVEIVPLCSSPHQCRPNCLNGVLLQYNHYEEPPFEGHMDGVLWLEGAYFVHQQ